MTTEGAGLERLALHINAARQLAQHHRGKALPVERADTLAAYLRAAQRLLRGEDAPPAPKPREPPKPQTGTARYRLWQRDPRCLWCGRLTRIEGVHEPDAATLDHLHPKGRRTGRALPLFVLACRECNSERGRPPDPGEVCPLLREWRMGAAG